MPQPTENWFLRHRIELGLGLRMSIAGLASFAVGHLFQVVQVYWAVLTAVIVMQASVGGSMKAMRDRFAGTFGGAVWGVAVTATIPHQGAVSTGIALAAALVPLAAFVGFHPNYRVAPVTAAIVLLGHPDSAGAVAAALDRVFEIGLGSIVALAVALLVSPARAHGALYAATRDALAAMSEQIVLLLGGVATPAGGDAVRALHDRTRAAIGRAAGCADDAARERRSHVSDAPDPEPLMQALRRLSSDLVIIDSTLPAPLPESVQVRLAGPATALAAAISLRMAAIGDALIARSPLPAATSESAAFDAYDAAIAALRRDGLTRALSDADVERLFGLSFGLAQLRRNLDDIAGCVAGLAP